MAKAPFLRFLASKTLVLFLFSTVSAFADDLLSLETHAFLSQGFIKTTANNYIANSQTGSFNFTEVGINFTKQLMDDLRVGIQLYADNTGATDTFEERLDWAYLDYHWSDRLAVQVGRVKIPFGLYNDISDIDAARVPVLLPQSVYPISNRNFLLAASGADVYGYFSRGPMGALEYRVYGGTIVLPYTNNPAAISQISSINTPYLLGGRLIWETPVEGLRLGVSSQHLRIDSSFLFLGSTTPVSAQIPALLNVASIEYLRRGMLLTAEYSRWYARLNPATNSALLPVSNSISDRGYVMASYRVNGWLQPGLYYSLLFPGINNRAGQANRQDDISATLRFDINRYWLVKLEGHYMSGDAGLDPTINNNLPLTALPSHWGVFLIKTTAYF